MKNILIIISIFILTYLFGQLRTNSEELTKKIYILPTKSTILVPTIDVPLEFHGYPCTEDCSGHEAGFEWAEEHDIIDPDDCGGKSESFIEGCRAYAEEYQNLNSDEDEY